MYTSMTLLSPLVFRGVDMVDQLGPAHHTAGIESKIFKERIFPGGERDGLACPGSGFCVRVNGKILDHYNWGWFSLVPPDRRA